jgi:hypothetical protein
MFESQTTKTMCSNSDMSEINQDLPVCIPTKTPQLANDAASTKPVTNECTNNAASPYSLSTGPKIRRREKKPGFLTSKGSGDILGGGEVSSAVALAVCGIVAGVG